MVMHGNITLTTHPTPACAIGTYKDAANNSACTTCPSLTSTQATTSTAATDCLCNPGYFRNDTLGTCAECPRHTYKPILSDSACTACLTPTAHTLTTGNTDTSACVCGPGYGLYNPDTTRVCRQCPLDTYQNGTTNSSCDAACCPTLPRSPPNNNERLLRAAPGTACRATTVDVRAVSAAHVPGRRGERSCTLCAPNAFTLEPGRPSTAAACVDPP